MKCKNCGGDLGKNGYCAYCNTHPEGVIEEDKNSNNSIGYIILYGIIFILFVVWLLWMYKTSTKPPTTYTTSKQVACIVEDVSIFFNVATFNLEYENENVGRFKTSSDAVKNGDKIKCILYETRDNETHDTLEIKVLPVNSTIHKSE